ncbi:MAG: tetratricopeptide repeat protein [Gemmatimonadetes bacterium]|nr:tetratricopeptide repeat protein [Gemmatimonadota bacterium]
MSKNTRRPGETVSERQVDPLATEDRFVTSMVGMSDWMKGNRDLGLIVAFLAMLGGAALVYYMDFKRDQINQAASRLESIHQSITISALEDAKAQLSTFVERFSGTPQAEEATVLLGRLHMEDEDFLVAISVLESAGLSMGTATGIQANSLLARAYEAQGRWSDAEEQHISVASASDLDFEVRESLEAAARIRITQRDFSGAIELYQEILEALANDDPRRGIYTSKMAEVTGSVE